MNRTVVKEEKYLLFSTCISNLLQEASEALLSEAFVLYSKREKLMALTYCCADGLTGLLSCAVLDEQWLLGQRPGLHLKVPGFEDCFVCKDKVSLLLLDLLDKVVQGESLVFELLHAQGLALRNVPYYHSVLAHTSFAQNCSESHFA